MNDSIDMRLRGLQLAIQCHAETKGIYSMVVVVQGAERAASEIAQVLPKDEQWGERMARLYAWCSAITWSAASETRSYHRRITKSEREMAS